MISLILKRFIAFFMDTDAKFFYKMQRKIKL
jgi:hypothetical protein